MSFLKNNKAAEDTILSYWCFSPGIAMNELIKLGIYNIILTSGTLSPISSFINSMQLPFPIQLENPHIIKPRQIFFSVVKKSSNNISLNSSYEKRSNEFYIKALGETIISISRNINGGILIFFPSYSVMDECIRVWKNTNVYGKLETVKPIFIEPKSSDQFNLISAQYRNSIDTTQKGIMMGICRGKASEGMDYSNEYGRCVIITGIPFPPTYNPRIMLQREFQDKYIPPNGIVRINGQQWYCQQASRAVNQAIGRVIRHKNDYGSIILLDERFSRRDQIDRLSAWLRPYLKEFDNINDLINPLTKFFHDLKINPPRMGNNITIKDNNKSHIKLEYDEEEENDNNNNSSLSFSKNINNSNVVIGKNYKISKPVISPALFNLYKKFDKTNTESSSSSSSSSTNILNSSESNKSFSNENNNDNSKSSVSKKLTLMFNTYKPKRIERNNEKDSIKNFFDKNEKINNNNCINSFAGEMIAKMNEKIESSQFDDDYNSQSTKSLFKKPLKVISQVKPLKNVFGKNVRIKQYEIIENPEEITHYSIDENEKDNSNESIVKPVMSFNISDNNNKKRKIAKPLEISNTPKKKRLNTQITSFFQVKEKKESPSSPQPPLFSFNKSFIDVDNENENENPYNNNSLFLKNRSHSMTVGTTPKTTVGISKVLTHDLITGKPIDPPFRPKLYPTSINDSYDDIDIDTNQYKANNDCDIIQLLLKGVGDCPICGSELPLYYTNCFHGFCRCCWIQMSHSDNRCPVCRLEYVRQKNDYIVIFDDD